MPKKLMKSIKYARAGARHAINTQRNLWIHFFVGLVVLAAALWINVTLLEMAILTLTIFGVITVELVNTALEEIVNILSPEIRAEAALVKNIAAAAVLAAALGAVLVGLFIFGPRLVRLA